MHINSSYHYRHIVFEILWCACAIITVAILSSMVAHSSLSLTVCICTYVVMYNNTLFCYRSFGILVWEVATYGKTPFSKTPTKDIVEMASNGSLKLTR